MQGQEIASILLENWQVIFLYAFKYASDFKKDFNEFKNDFHKVNLRLTKIEGREEMRVQGSH